MIISHPRPGRLLITAIVLGYVALDLLTVGFTDHASKQIAAGLVFLVLGLGAAFLGLRWFWRIGREFFR